MNMMRGIKRALYFGAHHLSGMPIGREYNQYLRQDLSTDSDEITRRLLIDLFEHSQRCVPYYARLFATAGNDYAGNPVAYLRRLPVLTKKDIRENFEALESNDLEQRKWRYNTTGGSTGEPLLFIQDNAYLARAGALQWLSHDWAGREFGEPGIRVWASPGDIHQNTMEWKLRTINYLTNDEWFDGLRMTPEGMRAFLERISASPPQLLIGYTECMYELACFATENGLAVAPQKAIITSAGTLYDYMREKIEAVFGCRVFNRYGSREVGDVACECSEHRGLHVFPWGNYVEVLNDEAQPVPPGVEGNLVITNLANYAMPLIRYWIGDRGTLAPRGQCRCGRRGQVLETVAGRTVEVFPTADGRLVNGAYFAILLHMRPWVKRFQIVQKSLSWLEFRIQRTGQCETQAELDEITRQAQAVLGPDCAVTFKFVDEIQPSPSGKRLFLFSEVRSRG